MQTLLLAHKRKRISGILVPSRRKYIYILTQPFSSFCHRSTPSRFGVCDCDRFSSIILINSANHRIKTAEALTAAGVPSTVILDSAVAYVMDKVDFVLVGSEAVVESGGLVNAVGSNQIAIIARAAHKPFYALAERSSSFSKR